MIGKLYINFLFVKITRASL